MMERVRRLMESALTEDGYLDEPGELSLPVPTLGSSGLGWLRRS
jgi:hypothetical protein